VLAQRKPSQISKRRRQSNWLWPRSARRLRRPVKRSDVDDQFRKADKVDPHHDNSLEEEGATSDGSGQTTPPDTTKTHDRDSETPR